MPKKKKSDSPIKLKLNHKRFYPSESVKCCGIKTDENLNWNRNIHHIAIKLNRANVLLSTIRNVNRHILRNKHLPNLIHI